jgi:hypothetical protein
MFAVLKIPKKYVTPQVEKMIIEEGGRLMDMWPYGYPCFIDNNVICTYEKYHARLFDCMDKLAEMGVPFDASEDAVNPVQRTRKMYAYRPSGWRQGYSFGVEELNMCTNGRGPAVDLRYINYLIEKYESKVISLDELITALKHQNADTPPPLENYI